MKVLNPTLITDGVLTSSTVAEDDAPPWAVGTTYALAAQVISGHHLYESLQADNVGHAVTDATWWVDLGSTNRWRMFDSLVNTQTEATASIAVTLAPGIINALALLEMTGVTQVQVVMVAGAETVYDRTVSLDYTPIVDWRTYFFEPSAVASETTLTDLPMYGEGVVTVTLTGGGAVKCGYLIVGDAMEIGDTEYGATVGIIDYSRKSTDEYGNTTIVQRAYSRRATYPVSIESARIAYLMRKLSALRATPALYIGSQEYSLSPLLVFGFYRDLSIDIAYPTRARCSLEIEGLI